MIYSINGANVWHCWGSDVPSHLYVVTHSKEEAKQAQKILNKLYGKTYMSATAAADNPLRFFEIEPAYIHEKLSEINVK